MEIVLKNRDGDPVTHNATADAVRIFLADGTTQLLTASEGDSGGGDTANNSIIPDPEWIDDICFWDYDGTLMLHFPVDDAAALSELPTPPEHEGLTFLGWNYTLEQVRATEYPLDIGAMYIPTDGKTHLRIKTGGNQSIPFNWSQTVSAGVSFDWGDGSSATTVSGTGVVTTSHTYTAIGEYDVTITVADGCVMTLGGGSSSKVFVGSSTVNLRETLIEAYIGNNVVLGDYAMYQNRKLSALTLPNTIESIPSNALYQKYCLPVIVIPNSVTSIGVNSIAYIGSIQNRLNSMVVSIPESVVTLGTSTISNSSGIIRISFPKSITAIPDYTLSYVYRLLRAFMSNHVTTFGSNNFIGCYHLEQISLPESLTAMGTYCIYNCPSLKKVKIPRSLAAIPQNFLYAAESITDFFLPASVTSIGSGLLYSAGSLKRITIEGVTKPTISTINGLREIIYLSETVPASVVNGGSYCEIYVPDSAYDAYYAAFGSSYQPLVHKLSEYPGKLPTYE